jgi:hypothetical protein
MSPNHGHARWFVRSDIAAVRRATRVPGAELIRLAGVQDWRNAGHREHDEHMTVSERQHLIDIRRALLHLHKTLLDRERTAYERGHGRTPAGELLNIIVRDPQFAWLRPFSEMIVRIDESLEIDALDGPEVDYDDIVAQTRLLVLPPEEHSPHTQRYHAALQEEPDAVLAHREVTTALKAAAERT